MLFVMEPKELSKRDAMLLHIVPTLLVFIAFMGVTLWSSYNARRDLNTEKSRVTTQVMKSTEQAITERFAIYEEVLRAGVGLYNSSDYVSRDEWRRFTETFELEKHYPGIQGLGYIELFPKSALGTVETRVQSEGLPSFSIFPAGDREQYSAALYLEPQEGRNLRALGYDMFTSPPRKAAMDEARDTNSAILSKRVQLIQDENLPNEPGLLMFLPLYNKASAHQTVDERRLSLLGYIYAPFRANDFFSDIYKNVSAGNPAVNFQVYDGDTTSNASLLYESPGFSNIKQTITPDITSKFRINNRDLKIVYRMPADSIGRTIRSRPTGTLFGGFLFSMILAGLVLVLLISRTRALAYAETREVQQAKDDLLSLASHQLRTPATGVKQYIGMLRQGYAGKLSKVQIELLEKAYQSNERQLGIIDEILHVARIDTGRISLNIEAVNITKLIKDVGNEQQESFKNRQQKFRQHVPKKDVIIQADPQYLRMVVENLISNASKYTESKGTIDVRLRLDTDTVIMEVKDTGVGIPENQQHMLFKKFSRIHNELTRQTEGSGIGLYITNKIIALHGGKITVESEANSGSLFTVTLPKEHKSNQQAAIIKKENT